MENTNQTTDTMPDIEAIKKEAYERGRADAMAEIEAANPVVLSGYRKGFWEWDDSMHNVQCIIKNRRA